MEEHIPSCITVDRAKLWAMQCCQRKMYTLLIERSAMGLWTSNKVGIENGIGSPDRSVHELKKVVDIKSRKVGRFIEWCV